MSSYTAAEADKMRSFIASRYSKRFADKLRGDQLQAVYLRLQREGAKKQEPVNDPKTGPFTALEGQQLTLFDMEDI